MTKLLKPFFIKIFFLFFTFIFLLPGYSQSFDKILTVGTKVAEPFAMKDKDGKWYGISVELWEKIAKELDLQYKWKELGLKPLLDGVSNSSIDVGIAAITITSERESKFDFSHSYYSTGLSIVTLKNLNDGWRSVLRGIFSSKMLFILLALFVILFITGTLTWLAERKKNPENFNPNPIKGIPAGMWWAAVTMTTVGYGDMTPQTVGGRMIALFWMFASLLMVSAVIAGVASTLTLAKSQPLISGPEDLPRARIASIENSSSDNYLENRQLKREYYPTVLDSLNAIEEGRSDAMVYDDPLLKYLTEQHFKNKLIVVDKLFELQQYGIAFPEGSPLREPVNRTMLKIIQKEEWQRVLKSYLGQ
ncbi:MAG: transporter substrate-binding domain-containing protein [Cocleimonas sp.]|nr:transporter substrate-binding domain-containing protein [Cocleimonas sp.]